MAHPKAALLDERVRVRGFIFFHPEEILLCPERSPASTPAAAISLRDLITAPADFKHRASFLAEFDKLGERYAGREVVVEGILRVRPSGMFQTPAVMIEASTITVAER